MSAIFATPLLSTNGAHLSPCRFDVHCCEEEAWQQQSGVPGLARGPRQPFYHVLVDLQDWDDRPPQSALTYVPEELLSAPEVGKIERTSWFLNL